ncbi:MAG: succinate dehydrogenase assembly factor 2 [Alphaproteobacteria bacterium GM7ARS4]|nr:succinate dehydrogenase assembly factor 2 [Alphaproteobacteria bacterium GM7ARS4]
MIGHAGQKTSLVRDEQSRRKRLLYRCCRRGTQEMDILIEEFIRQCMKDQRYPLSALEAFVALSDDTLYGLLTHRAGQKHEADGAMRHVLETFLRRYAVETPQQEQSPSPSPSSTS